MFGHRSLVMFVWLTTVGCARTTDTGFELPDPPDPPDPVEPCAPGDSPTLDVSQFEGGFGELVDGADLAYGMPPQGGAPFAPFVLRMSELDNSDWMMVYMSADDVHSGDQLGYAEMGQGFICSNAGDNDGYLVGAEIHMRFPGWSLQELETREVDIHVEVTDVRDVTAVFESRLRLVWSL